MPMNLHNVRLRLLAKYGSCDKEDIPIVVSIFLAEYQNCDWDDLPIMISNYLKHEASNLPYVVSDDETDEDEEENEYTYYPHKVSQFVLQDSSILEPNLIEDSDLEDLDDDEYNDYYSNDYSPRSFKFVFQDDSEDEEEEYYQYDNHPQPTIQAVLRESNSFEHKPMENSAQSECSNSDFVESMEEKVQESVIILDLEAEKSAATTSRLEEKESNVSCKGSNNIVGHNDIIKELQEMLEINDQKLDELVQSGVGDDPILDAEFDKFYQADGEQAQVENFGENDSITVESKSGLISNCLPCDVEYKLLMKPKSPNEFLKEMIFNGEKGKSNIGYEQTNEVLKFDNLTSECVFISYFEEPPDCFSHVKNHLYLRVSLTRVLIKSWEDWKVNTRVVSFYLRMYCKNDKTKESILQDEYDWKGVEILIDYPP